MKKGYAICFSALALLWVSISFSHCSQKVPTEELAVPRPDFKDLIGEWQWVESFEGWGGRKKATAGHTEILIFGADATFTHRFNQEQLQRGVYQTKVNGESVAGNRLLTLYPDKRAVHKPEAIPIMYWSDQALYFRGADTLVISPWNVTDAYTHVLVRRKPS
jgi:hypothetical protein